MLTIERELSVTIKTQADKSSIITISDNESSDETTFAINTDVDCNNADNLAQKIGYELLSWVDIAREIIK